MYHCTHKGKLSKKIIPIYATYIELHSNGIVAQREARRVARDKTQCFLAEIEDEDEDEEVKILISRYRNNASGREREKAVKHHLREAE